MAAKIRKGDQVMVMVGKDKGKTGRVIRVDADKQKLWVEKLNMVKRHTKGTQDQEGGIIEKEAAIHASNIMLVDPKEGKPTRVGFRFVVDDAAAGDDAPPPRKVRYAKRSGQVLDT